MERKDCVELGYISKAHGIRGEVKAVFDVYDLREYLQEKRFFLAKPEEPLKSFAVRSMRVVKNTEVILGFQGIQYRDEAEVLKGSTIFFPIAELPELPDGHFYFFQVIGYQVVDQTHGELGPVKGIYDGTAQDILTFEHQGKEVLLPITDEFVLRADHEARIIHTAIPEGLLETYLE
jgi:16S rRNA processing protein RimM